MSHPASIEPGRLDAALRWGAAGALVLALHLGIGWLVVGRAMLPHEPDAAAPGIAIDLEPVTVPQDQAAPAPAPPAGVPEAAPNDAKPDEPRAGRRAAARSDAARSRGRRASAAARSCAARSCAGDSAGGATTLRSGPGATTRRGGARRASARADPCRVGHHAAAHARTHETTRRRDTGATAAPPGRGFAPEAYQARAAGTRRCETHRPSGRSARPARDRGASVEA